MLNFLSLICEIHIVDIIHICNFSSILKGDLVVDDNKLPNETCNMKRNHFASISSSLQTIAGWKGQTWKIKRITEWKPPPSSPQSIKKKMHQQFKMGQIKIHLQSTRCKFILLHTARNAMHAHRHTHATRN